MTNRGKGKTIMKNTAKKLLCAALVLVSIFCFCACDNGKESADSEAPVIKENAAGRYELCKIEWEDGVVAEGEVLKDSEAAMGDMYVTLYKDGTAILSLMGQVMDMEFSKDTMWRADNKNFSYDYSVSNGKVVLKGDGDTYTFAKY